MTLDRLRNLGFLLAFLLLGVMLFSLYGAFRSAIEGGNWVAFLGGILMGAAMVAVLLAIMLVPERRRTGWVEALTNVNLSEYIWVRALGTGLPDAWYLRELFGIVLVVIYVFALPVLLARGVLKKYYEKMGAPRYYIGVFLFLMMMSLPIKMLARWIFNLKYIVAIPEFFFNI